IPRETSDRQPCEFPLHENANAQDPRNELSASHHITSISVFQAIFPPPPSPPADEVECWCAATRQACGFSPATGTILGSLLGPSARSWSSLHSSELLSRPRYRGQTHFRAVHGDQVGHRGERPDQANRDHDGDSHHPCAHLHPLYVAL